MTRFTIPIKDILGSVYYRYSISTNAINLTLGNSVTVTVTCKSVFGGAVSGKELTLYYGGVSQGNQTTDSNGVATWTITPTDTGLKKIAVGDAVMFITVGGWQTKTVNTYTTFYVNERERLAMFKYYRTNYNFTSTSEVTLHSGAIPSAYRPPVSVICTSYNVTITGAVASNGNIVAYTNSTGTKNINLNAFWHY